MADKKFLIKKGEKITIEVNRPAPRADLRKGQIPKGIIETRAEQPYLPRRLPPARDIEFFDLAQIPDGDAWLDWDFTQAANPGFVSNVFTADDPTEADFTALDDAVIAIENLAEHSRLIRQEHMNLFNLTIFTDIGLIDLASDARFSENKIRLTEEELASEYVLLNRSRLLGDGVRFSTAPGGGQSKVTATPSFDAEAVDFRLKNGDKVYLVPKFAQSAGENTVSTGTVGVDEILHYYWLNWKFVLHPRAVYLDPASPFYGAVISPPSDFPNFSHGSGSDLASWELFYEEMLIERTFDDSQGYFQSVDVATSAVLTEGEMAATDFPAPVGFPPPPDVPTEPSFSANVQRSAEDTPEGHLLAIVVRGGARFYVWQPA